MPFPRQLLLENEEVAIDMRPHWWELVAPSVFAVGVIIATIVIASVVDGDIGKFLSFLMLALVFISLSALVLNYLRWTHTNFVVTNERIMYRTGIIAKHAKEIPLDHVENLAFNQTVFERIIGSGDLTVESAGETGAETFHNMRHPNLLHKEIYRQIEVLQDHDAKRQAGFVQQAAEQAIGGANGHDSIPDQIHKLDALRQRGLVTDEEFEAKKRELLDRM